METQEGRARNVGENWENLRPRCIYRRVKGESTPTPPTPTPVNNATAVRSRWLLIYEGDVSPCLGWRFIL